MNNYLLENLFEEISLSYTILREVTDQLREARKEKATSKEIEELRSERRYNRQCVDAVYRSLYDLRLIEKFCELYPHLSQPCAEWIREHNMPKD
jgi:hypothetical protein